MAAPAIVKPIPNQLVNELAAFGPFNLTEFIKAPDGSESPRFSAEVKDGGMLPKGLICTSDGIITGIPARETQGNYELLITAENADGKVEAPLVFVIKPAPQTESGYFDKLKAQVWEAVEKKMPIPEFSELYNLPIRPQDIWYLLERYSAIKMWDAFNLSPPGELVPLQLEGASKHYHVFDRGSCLVGCPKDLFSQERTLEDGLQTARAMAREVFNRGWTVELVGYLKYTRAAWIEIQHLSDKTGKVLDVINYDPSDKDMNIYTAQALQFHMNKNP